MQTILFCFGKSLNEVMDKYGRLKNPVVGKCLMVNVKNKRYAVIIWKEK